MTPSAMVADRIETAGDAATSATDAAVAMRPFPYPYKAALAVCSDLDDTPDAHDYFEMLRFLNTTEPTSLGAGIGLEVGNSIYFDMPPDQFSYWNADREARARIHALIASGHIDCLHSYGDLATTRAHAGRALGELARHGCELKVWVDHAVAPSNFGADIMKGQGDVVGAPAYHADLTCAFGIAYVWRGRVTSVVGQDTRRRLGGIARARHPLASATTVAKEGVKGMLGRVGSGKYASHARNDVVWEARLRSGQRVFEFLRSNPSFGGISVHETADGFGEVVTSDMLRRLVEREAATVLYTHLGKTRMPGRAVAPATRRALERLARFAADGDLLVTTTRRLLDLCRAKREVSWTAQQGPDGVRIDLSAAASGRDHRGILDGLTFYVPNGERATLVVNGRRELRLQANPPDHRGRASVSLPWPRLVFPGLHL